MSSACHAKQIPLLLSVVTLACALRPALAETPGEIPKPWTYEGSMKLQEQQRQQDQQSQQQPQSTQGGSRAAAGSAAAAEEVRRSWQKRPPLPADRNPLLGKWNPQGSAPGGQGGGQANPAAALLGTMLGGACDSMFGRGTIEFRPGTLVSIESNGRESVLNHVEYRGDGNRVAVLPQDPGSIGVLVFNFDAKDRIRAEGLGCVMARPGTAPPPVAASAAAKSATATPAPVTPAGAVLSVSVVSASPGSTKVAGIPLWVLKGDAQVALIKGGLTSTPYGTVLQNWMRACRNRAPECQQGAQALKAYSVGIATTDANGRAQTPPLPVGRYWILSDTRADNRRIMWNQPVDLKPGGISVTLDQHNSMPVD